MGDIVLVYLGPLVQTEHCLNATAYLSIVADHVHAVLKKKRSKFCNRNVYIH